MAESEMPDEAAPIAIPDAGIDIANPVVCRDDDGYSAATEPWDGLFFDIDAKAREVLADMKESSPRNRKMDPCDWQWWAYSLTAYAAFHGGPVPASLLQLLFTALGCKPGYLPDEVKAVLREPPGKIARRAEWREAVSIVAAEPDVSKNALADRIGVDRTMVRAWLASDEFRQAVIDAEFGLSITGRRKS